MERNTNAGGYAIMETVMESDVELRFQNQEAG